MYPSFQQLFLLCCPGFKFSSSLQILFNTHKTCISKIKFASSFSYHWPCSCYICQNIQVYSSLNSLSPSSRFCFVQSQTIKIFFASSKRGKVLTSLQHSLMVYIIMYILLLFYCCRLCLICDGTRAETRFHLSAEQTSPFKSAGVSLQSTTGRRAVHISLLVLHVQACVLQSFDAYWLPTPFASFPFTSPPVRHCVPSHFNWTLLLYTFTL
jgi:hypothetical protein